LQGRITWTTPHTVCLTIHSLITRLRSIEQIDDRL